MTKCRLCGEPKEDWQVYCGAACCVAWEMGIRTKEELKRVLGEDGGDT